MIIGPYSALKGVSQNRSPLYRFIFFPASKDGKVHYTRGDTLWPIADHKTDPLCLYMKQRPVIDHQVFPALGTVQYAYPFAVSIFCFDFVSKSACQYPFFDI